MAELYEACGCNPAGALARLVVACVPALMGANVGRWLQILVAPAAGSPYEGSLLGAAIGLVTGLVLARRGATMRGGVGGLADLALCLGAAVWIAGIAVRVTAGASGDDVAAAWAAALGGLIAIVALAR